MSGKRYIKRIKVFLSIGAILVSMGFAVYINVPQYNNWQSLNADRDRLIQKELRLARELKELEVMCNRFESDREFVELEARRCNMSFPGETVFKFD